MTSHTLKRGDSNAPGDSRSDDPAEEPGLDRAVQARIGDQLRAMYDTLMQQPIPDRLAELLDRLDKGEESNR